jgi:integrase
MKVPKKDKRRVPVTKFQALLDVAEYPRDRMIIALGLYLFLRQSEMATLRIKDINLTNGEINVTVHKTGDFDIMPICSELDNELRRYLTWYTEQCDGLDPEWFLVPSRTNIGGRLNNGTFSKGQNMKLRPERMMTKIEDVAKNALELIGHPVRDENGKGLFEGIHTLRRSGARALFDEMRNQGYDGALQRVRAMLHHASGTMTERYLGISVERTQRNEALIGKSMFSIGGGNIVPLGGRDGASQAQSV